MLVDTQDGRFLVICRRAAGRFTIRMNWKSPGGFYFCMFASLRRTGRVTNSGTSAAVLALTMASRPRAAGRNAVVAAIFDRGPGVSALLLRRD